MPSPVDSAIELRDKFLREEPWLTASELAGGVEKHELLSAAFRGQPLFPKFQFLSGIPHPRLPELSQFLPSDGRGWPAVLWCFSPTTKLGGTRPADLFATDPDAVIDAARRQFQGDSCD